VVNCKHFCPQCWERVYFFGSWLDLECPDMEWENIYPKNNTRLLRDVLEQDSSNCPDVAKWKLFEQQWEMVQRKFGEIEGALI